MVKRFDVPQTIFAVGGLLHGEGSETMVMATDYDTLYIEMEALRQERDALMHVKVCLEGELNAWRKYTDNLQENMSSTNNDITQLQQAAQEAARELRFTLGVCEDTNETTGRRYLFVKEALAALERAGVMP